MKTERTLHPALSCYKRGTFNSSSGIMQLGVEYTGTFSCNHWQNLNPASSSSLLKAFFLLLPARYQSLSEAGCRYHLFILTLISCVLAGRADPQPAPSCSKKAQTSLTSAALLCVSVEFLTTMDGALSLSDFCALCLCMVRAC